MFLGIKFYWLGCRLSSGEWSLSSCGFEKSVCPEYYKIVYDFAGQKLTPAWS